MTTRTRRLYSLILVVAAVLMGAVAASAQPVTPADLIYTGAVVQTQVDVNGAVAVSLLGSALDGLVGAAQEQAKAQTAGGGAPALPIPPNALMALPLLGPVRDIIKSVSHVTVLAMTPATPVPGEQFLRYYTTALTPRGWTGLLTVQDKTGPTFCAMLAPGGKGIFVAMDDPKQLMVALVTTERPLGDLLGQVVQAAATAAPQFASMMGHGQFGGPPAPKALAPAAAPPPPAAEQ